MELRKIAILMSTAVILIVLGYLAILVYMTWPISHFSISNAGVLGDSFGIINSLFSGLAFAGLIVTILLQAEELKESRKMFRAQKLEDSFYRLLGFYKDNLNDISIYEQKTEKRHAGVAGLSYQLGKFQESINRPKTLINDDEYQNIIEQSIERTLTYQSRYLGTLESLLSLIVSDISQPSEQRFYIKVISSQLTIHEVKYIFYRCLASNTDDEIVKLMYESKLLHLRIQESGIPKKIISIYNSKHGDNLIL